MVRVVKDPEVRKQEIIDTSYKLFVKKGYNNTSVSDITKTVGIAQGTFYYYFKTKEEVLDAIVVDYVKGIVEKIQPIADKDNIDVIERMKMILEASFTYDLKNYPEFQNIHGIKNVDMQQKFLIETTKQFIPIMVNVIKEGVEKNIFQIEYPVEILEIILVGTNFMTDSSNFNFDDKKRCKYIFALQEMLEKVLVLNKGTLSFLTDVFEGMEEIF